MSKLVLVVDDEEDFLFEVRTMLERAGLEVLTASSGEEALKLLKDKTPDLILLDVMMPGLDGWEVSKRLKEKEETKDITVSMLTVMSSPEDKLKSLQNSGAEWHISKPIEMKKFIDTVMWLLEESKKKGG